MINENHELNVLSPLKGTTLQSWKINTTNFTSVYNPVFAETIVRLWRICLPKKLNKLPLPLSEKIFIKAVIYFLCTGVDTYGTIYPFIVLITAA